MRSIHECITNPLMKYSYWYKYEAFIFVSKYTVFVFTPFLVPVICSNFTNTNIWWGFHNKHFREAYPRVVSWLVLVWPFFCAHELRRTLIRTQLIPSLAFRNIWCEVEALENPNLETASNTKLHIIFSPFLLHPLPWASSSSGPGF